jgi:Tol biopolymer transport system component/DNA-binding winged helix-turn-helix (wHTH) protein
MNASTKRVRLIRFSVFELDLDSGELFKQGRKVKLPGQPFDLLVALLERPGEVVTREELQQKIWPSDTVVDFDPGLNKAINKVREALGDLAESPHFIETLPRRGYRFIGSIQAENGAETPAVEVEPAGPELALGVTGTESVPDTIRVPSLSRASAQPALRRRPRLYAAGALAILAGVVLFWLTRPLPRPRVTATVQITNDGRPKSWPLLTDGVRLFFNSVWCCGAVKEVYQVPVKGGEPAILSLPVQDAFVVDISPDRTELLLCRHADASGRCELWVAPLLGGAARRMGDLVASSGTAAWSLDGQQVVYAKGRELHVARSDGTEVRKLATLALDPFWVRWSPDGGSVRFSVAPNAARAAETEPLLTDPAASIWEARIDGDRAYPLLPGWNPASNACCGNWTPDGKYFVFEAVVKGKAGVWALREKRGWFQRAERGPFQLTDGPLGSYWPVPSADGKRLFVNGLQSRFEFLRYDLKTGQMVSTLGGISGTHLEFSKDGKWISYISWPDRSLWRGAADGSQRLRLTSAPIQALLPRWSPDGKQIAFMGAREGAPSRIYVVSFDGGTPKRVTNGESGNGCGGDADGSWSPDGASLVFGCSGYGPIPASTSIHVVDLKTGRVSNVSGSEGMFSPRWSPDGRFIAGLSTSGCFAKSGCKLLLYDFQTRKQSELSSMRCGRPSWSPDGESLFYLAVGDGPSWWKIRMHDRKTERIAALKDLRIEAGWFAPAPNDSLITWRDAGVDEIYALDWEAP